MMKRVIRWLALAGASSLCAACGGSLFESKIPAPDRYVIAAAPAAAAATQSAALQADLSIGRPDVAPGLDTDRIAVLRGRRLEYFRGAQWGGPVAEIVQALLVASFEGQRVFHSVIPEQARVSGDYLLDVEVRAFQAEYASEDSAPQVQVKIVGRVIRITDRQLVDTLQATASRRSDRNRMNAVAAAFEAAAQEVALQLAREAASAVAADAADRVSTSRAAADR